MVCFFLMGSIDDLSKDDLNFEIKFELKSD